MWKGERVGGESVCWGEGGGGKESKKHKHGQWSSSVCTNNNRGDG